MEVSLTMRVVDVLPVVLVELLLADEDEEDEDVDVEVAVEEEVVPDVDEVASQISPNDAGDCWNLGATSNTTRY